MQTYLRSLSNSNLAKSRLPINYLSVTQLFKKKCTQSTAVKQNFETIGRLTWMIWMNEIWRYLSWTHWGRVTHICVNKLTIIGSDNGLSPGRRQAIIWTNAGILLIGPLGTNFSEIIVGIQTFSFRKMHLKMSSAFSVQFVSASMS